MRFVVQIVARALLLLLAPFCRTRGTQRALARLQTEIRSQRRDRGGRRAARRYRGRRGLLLNLGSGQRGREGWVNVDLSPKDADCRVDLRERLPFDDASARTVYTEHFLEHLDYPHDAERFLAECRRVLAPGGTIHVGVPDTEWPLRAYAGADDSYFEFVGSGLHPAFCRTRLDHVNWHFRQGGEHRHAFDTESLLALLGRAGFVDVAARGFDPELDSESRRRGTIYAVATRPAEPS